MVTEVNASMLPTVARRLGLTKAAFESEIAQRYPAVAKGLVAWSSIKPGAVELVGRQAASVQDGTKMNGFHFTPLPWYIMGPGIVLLLVGGAALLVERQRTPT
jgi:hypothetical protein